MCFVDNETVMTSPIFGRKDWHQSLVSLQKLTGRGIGHAAVGGTAEEPPAAAEPTASPPHTRRPATRASTSTSTAPNEPFAMTRAQYEDILARQRYFYDSICEHRADSFEMLSLQRSLYSTVYPDQAEEWFAAATAGREDYRRNLPPFGKDEGGGSWDEGIGGTEEEGGLSEGYDEEEEWNSEDDEFDDEEEEDEGNDSES